MSVFGFLQFLTLSEKHCVCLCRLVSTLFIINGVYLFQSDQLTKEKVEEIYKTREEQIHKKQKILEELQKVRSLMLWIYHLQFLCSVCNALGFKFIWVNWIFILLLMLLMFFLADCSCSVCYEINSKWVALIFVLLLMLLLFFVSFALLL